MFYYELNVCFSKLSPGGLCHVTVYMTCVMVTG